MAHFGVFLYDENGENLSKKPWKLDRFWGGQAVVSEPYEIMSTDKQRKALGAAAKVRRPFEGSEGARAKTGEQAIQK